ncbi:hypothetical protein [Nocardioides speluncae]|uniref:hypothetical protein n=1 Tax=Nocardioides speluncae TaxID=2670337 RepID=UPI0012B1824D|nr:hypothetical protein [Nocardioides speluncae]
MIGLAAMGCGEDDGGGDGGGAGEGSGSTDAQASPEDLHREFATRLAEADTDGVCALFTEEGQAAYAQSAGAESCSGAVDAEAADKADVALDYADAFDEDYPEVTDQFADWGGNACRLGGFKAKKTADGWLLIDHEPQYGTCGG